MLTPDPGAARLYTGLRFTSWRFLAGRSHNGGMRAIIAALAVLGGGVILAACAASVATGDASEAGWLVVGPMSFLVIGLVGFLRQPGNRVVWWLVGVGVAFGCDVALGDVFLPMAENHWGVTSSITAAIALLEHWFAVAGPVAGVGLFGLFPSGRPERADERVVIWTVVLAGFLLPLLEAVSGANIAPAGGPPDSAPPVLYRILYVPALAPLGGAAEAAYRTFPVWPLIGVVLLALRYRRTDGAQRRQIRWLFLGMVVSFSLWISLALLWQLADPDNAAATVASEVLSPLALATTVGSMLVALFYTGVFGIDEPARRAFVNRVLRVSITVVVAALAILIGVLTSRPRRPPSRWRPVSRPGRRARPFGAVWSTPRTAGYSARGWRATPASAALARA